MILSWIFTWRERRYLHFLRWAYRRGHLTEYPDEARERPVGRWGLG